MLGCVGSLINHCGRSHKVSQHIHFVKDCEWNIQNSSHFDFLLFFRPWELFSNLEILKRSSSLLVYRDRKRSMWWQLTIYSLWIGGKILRLWRISLDSIPKEGHWIHWLDSMMHVHRYVSIDARPKSGAAAQTESMIRQARMMYRLCPSNKDVKAEQARKRL